MLKNIFTILLIFFLTSCAKNWYKPYGHTMFKQMPEGGTPGFNLGWIHGCQSGLGSQFATAIFHTFYTWSRDPDITSSNPDIPKIRARYREELKDINWDNPDEIKKNFSDYNTIFWGSHSFCRHSVLGILQTADMDPILPGDERWNMKHGIGNIWRLTGKGDTRWGVARSGGSNW